jgi:hypothetical protein
MFNYIENKEQYIDFMDGNYLDNYYKPIEYTEEESKIIASTIVPQEHWFTFNKVKVYIDGIVEVIGAMFFHPNKGDNTKIIGEFTNGSSTIVFRENKVDPITQWEGVLSDGKIINYESSRALRLGVGNLNTGSNYEDYDRAPSVNMWLGRSWIEDEEEELYFLVESREMLDEVASYYGLPVPYDDDLKVVLNNNLQSIRFKSYDLNHEGEGNFVAVVVAGIVFKDDTATMLKLYETTRWDE